MTSYASKKLKISASILSSNFINLDSTIKILDQQVDSLHLDVMDGHFVPNLTFGPKIISDIRSATKLPLDTHLMISNPSSFINEYIAAGSNSITFHVETEKKPKQIVQKILDLGCKAGLSLKPQTSWESIIPFLEIVDRILIMTVEPGFGGQKFMKSMLQKIESIVEFRERLREQGSKEPFIISVDGGINPKTIKHVASLGIDEIVVGSYLFVGNLSSNVKKVREIIGHQ